MAHFIARRKAWFTAMAVLEAANASCGTAIPLALGKITRAVTLSRSSAPVQKERARKELGAKDDLEL